MDYIGIVFLAIVGIYFINGCKKGFIVNLLESLKTIIGFIVAFLFCGQVGDYLLDGTIGLSLINNTEDSLLRINEIFNTVVTSENQALITENIWEYLKIPASLSESLKELINEYIANEPGLSIGYYVSKAICSYATLAIGFVLILLVFSIVFWIIIKLFKSLSKNQGIFSRFLGGLVGVIRAAIFIGIICYIIGMIYVVAPESTFGTFINTSLNHEVGIFKFFYEHNIVSYIVNLILSKM